jgi:ComF family protein
MSAARSSWIRFSERFLSAIYPPTCALCGLDGTAAICEKCWAEIGSPVFEVQRHAQGDPLDFSVCLYHYGSRAGQAVRELKFHRKTSLAPLMAQELARAVDRLSLDDADFVAPVPLHWRRRAIRGFNQSELLCEALDARKVRREAILIRHRHTKPQANLDYDDRMRNLSGAFTAFNCEGARVLLVDDVLTSGQTARECARTLKSAGAREVGGLFWCSSLNRVQS